MNIKKFLTENEFWQEDCPGVLQTAVLLSQSFIKQNEHLGKGLQNCVILMGRNDYLWELTLEKDKQNIFRSISKKGFPFLKEKTKSWGKCMQEIESILIKVRSPQLKRMSDSQLADLYEDFFDKASTTWSYPIMGEGFDVFSTNELIPLIKDTLKITEEEARQIALTMCMSKTKSFLDEEKLSLLKIALLEDTSKDLQQHLNNYFWLADNYKWKSNLDIEYFKKELDDIKSKSKEEISKKIEELSEYENKTIERKAKILQKYNIPKNLKEILEMLEHLSWWIDVRKVMQLKLFHIIFIILEDVENRFELEKNSTKYLLPKEITSILRKNKRFDYKKRIEGYLFYLDSDFKEIFIDGKEAADLIDDYLKQGIAEELKGITATVGKGNIKAKVNIIRDVTTDKFESSSILVASMTRPEFVPLMRKASGIITDEGGITCHAAIVSRELGIPCIIGTKNATKLLRTGDLVEMDLKSGIVKRLK